jgi:hypothetical protein
MISANVGFELPVAFRLEVVHHFTKSCAVGRAGGCEPPVTLGATKATKTLLLNPYQLPCHEGAQLTGANFDGLSGVLHRWKIFGRGNV